MALEQKLSLRLSQKLVMTPSLQQAIKLLQMTRLEIEGVLSQELEENPVLERTEEVEQSEAEADEDTENEADDDPMDDIDLEAYFDEYLDTPEYAPSGTVETREAVPIENTLREEPDLYDHLLWQLHMMDLPAQLREIAELIIGNLNEDGFLKASIEEIQLLGADPDEVFAYQEALARYESYQDSESDGEDDDSDSDEDSDDDRNDDDENDDGDSSVEDREGEDADTADDHAEDLNVNVASPDEDPPQRPEVPGYPESAVEAGLALVKSLDPPGVACRDLRESLLFQLDKRGDADSLAYRMIEEEWPRVLKRQFPAIAKAFGVPLKELEEPVNEIKTLETRPGRQFGGERAQYVEPDVVAVKVGDKFVIQLNDDGMPRLRVSGAYRKMLREMRRDGRQAEAQQYIKEKMRSAMWLIKSLDQRQRTIYKVANSIVKQQNGFLERGIEHLRPMVLRDVAEDIGMHESTVSRVVSNKYIHTPRGLFPMKFFFHSGIDRDYGEDISSLTVKRKIEDMIGEENPKKPLSDSELMRRLNDQGINIARRTVAKYRDELGIPSSTDRKQVF